MYIHNYVKTQCHPQTGSTIVLSLDEDRATDTSKMYRKFHKIWISCGFGDMRADRQTDRHANHNTTKGEVMKQ